MGKSLAEKVIALRWWIVGAWVAGAIALAVFVVEPDPAANELQTFLPVESASVRAADALAKSFPRSAGLSQAAIVVERRPGGSAGSGQAARLTDADLAALNGLAGRLRESLPEAFAGALPAGSLSVRAPGDFPGILGANPFVSGDGASAVAVVQIPATFVTIRAARVVDYVRRTVSESSFPAGLDVAVTGSAAFGADYAAAAKKSHSDTVWVTVVAVLVILLVVYRAPLAAGTVLATIALAATVAHFGLHIASHLGLHVGTAEKIFVFVLVFGVGVDYSLLYLSRFRESLEVSPGARAAAVALSATAATILASAGTDIAGLAMLSTARFKVFQTAGMAVPIGLAVALAAALTLVPAVVAIARRRLFWPSRRTGSIGSRRIWPAVAGVVAARPGVVLIVTLVALAVPASRAFRLDFVYDALTGLGSEYGSVRGREMTRRHWPVGQTSPTIVLLQARSPAPASELPAAAARLTVDLAKLDGVADVRSLAQPLGRAGVNPATGLLLGAAGEKVRAEYLSPDGRATRLDVVLTHPGFSIAAMDTLQQIQRSCRDALPDGVAADFSGVTAEMADIRTVTQSDFYRIAALVLAVVFLIVLLLLREPIVSAFMVGSMVLSYLAALGAAWWFFTGVCGLAGLDWKVEVFLFVVMLAVGVDYNIFLAARLSEESRRAGPREAARTAIIRTGGIISSAGLIMAAALGSLMISSISLFVQLGFAFAVGMLLETFIVRPLLLPAFAILTGRLGRRRRGTLPPGSAGAAGR